MRLLPLLLLLPNLPLLSARQVPLPRSEGEVEVEVDNSPFIFTALNGLLKQWPNTYAPAGFSVVPGVIPASTLLYHVRQDAGAPANPEWLAFDAEYSYGIFAPFGECFLNTYRAKRELKILYFDGGSAILVGGGRDSQDALLYGKVKENGTEGLLEGEYRRARDLCRWAKELQAGVEGYVRMNAGFELIWCDFDVGIELVSRLNITIPSTQDEDPEPPEDECPTPEDGGRPLGYEEHRLWRPQWLWPGRGNLWGHGSLSNREPPFPPPEDNSPSPGHVEHHCHREHGGHPPWWSESDSPPSWGHDSPPGEDPPPPDRNRPPPEQADQYRPGNARTPRGGRRGGEDPLCPPDQSPSLGGGDQHKPGKDCPPPGREHPPPKKAYRGSPEYPPCLSRHDCPPPGERGKRPLPGPGRGRKGHCKKPGGEHPPRRDRPPPRKGRPGRGCPPSPGSGEPGHNCPHPPPPPPPPPPPGHRKPCPHPPPKEPKEPGRDPPYPKYPRHTRPNSPFEVEVRWEWIRSVTWKYDSSEARVILDTCRMTTFYNLSLPGQAPPGIANAKLTHRLTNITHAQAKEVRREIEYNLLHKDLYCSGTDWREVAEGIARRYLTRLIEIQGLLHPDNCSHKKLHQGLRRLSHALVLPFFEMKSGLEEAETRCVEQYTGKLDLARIQPSEKVLINAVEGVLRRVCKVAFGIYNDTTVSTTLHSKDIEKWAKEVDALINWIDWSGWHRCERLCAWDEVCAIPLWPILGTPWDKRQDEKLLMHPRCIGIEFLWEGAGGYWPVNPPGQPLPYFL